MRWIGRRGSANVEDRRGMRVPGGMPGIGCGGLILVLGIAWLTGADPTQLLSLLSETQQGAPVEAPAGATGEPRDELGQFASVVLADTETSWGEIFAASGGRYE